MHLSWRRCLGIEECTSCSWFCEQHGNSSKSDESKDDEKEPCYVEVQYVFTVNVVLSINLREPNLIAEALQGG